MFSNKLSAAVVICWNLQLKKFFNVENVTYEKSARFVKKLHCSLVSHEEF